MSEQNIKPAPATLNFDQMKEDAKTHLAEYFKNTDEKNQPSKSDIALIEDTVNELFMLIMTSDEKDKITIEASKYFLKAKVVIGYGTATKYFDDLNKILGGCLPLREINRCVRPLRGWLAAERWKAEHGRAPAPIELKAMKPLPMKIIRAKPGEAFDQLDSNAFKTECGEVSAKEFNKKWAFMTEPTLHSKLMTELRKMQKAISELPAEKQRELGKRSTIVSQIEFLIAEISKQKAWLETVEQAPLETGEDIEATRPAGVPPVEPEETPARKILLTDKQIFGVPSDPDSEDDDE